jgi:hypothetical protein
MPRATPFISFVVGLVGLGIAASAGQRGGAFRASRDHPAITYSTGEVSNVVSDLNDRIQAGEIELLFQGRGGYLDSVLRALDVPVESQVAVFSKTSRQASEITSQNPRALFFGDTVAVGWVRDGDELELATQDRRQGTVFYTLTQTPADQPQFTRADRCLACHLSWDTLGVPGLQVLSVAPLSSDPTAYATGFVSDHRSPLTERWGGWYVTGQVGTVAHMGNVEVTDVDDPDATLGSVPPQMDSLVGAFDLDGFPSEHSDVAALMVLEHQAGMTNLITRVGWEARRVEFRESSSPGDEGPDLVTDAALQLVDYMLFVDEPPLPTKITGSSGFAEYFSAREPRDSRGRSLRELDLERRLFRYPCSYMIYTDAFDALPVLAKDAVYARLWSVLSGQEPDEVYASLSRDDRQAIVEILRDTKTDLPVYFEDVGG